MLTEHLTAIYSFRFQQQSSFQMLMHLLHLPTNIMTRAYKKTVLLIYLLIGQSSGKNGFYAFSKTLALAVSVKMLLLFTLLTNEQMSSFWLLLSQYFNCYVFQPSSQNVVLVTTKMRIFSQL